MTGVNLGDIKAKEKQVGDFRQAVEGDQSVEGKPLKFRTAIELGHIFKLNLRYSKPMKANFLDASGKENPMIMGCYGIGVNRILAAAIEQFGDDKGIVWPKNIAPFQVHVVVIDPKDEQSRAIVLKLADSAELADKGVDFLIDDREASAGVKFNDADLLGLPVRLILGPKNLKNGQAEIKIRKSGEATLVDLASIPAQLLQILDKTA